MVQVFLGPGTVFRNFGSLVVCLPPRWDGICRAARRETRHGKHNGGYGSALERFHRAHLIPARAAIYRTINDQLTIAGAAARGAARHASIGRSAPPFIGHSPRRSSLGLTPA